jgi:hypothetical protein
MAPFMEAVASRAGATKLAYPTTSPPGPVTPPTRWPMPTPMDSR